jgi:hypothetical protein
MKARCLLLLTILLLSCKPNNKRLFEFNPTSIIENEIRLTEIADDIQYIRLDNSFSLGIIYDNIILVNNSVYLSAKDFGILVYNREGKLIKKIGCIGRGPGEYIYCFLFTIDEKTETVYIWDAGDIIKAYSPNGYFVRTFSLKEYGSFVDAFEAYYSKLFISYSPNSEDSKYKWIFLDTIGNLIEKKEWTTPVIKSRSGGVGGVFKFENRLSYWNQFTDTVYAIMPDLSEKPSFIISPGEHRLPKINNYSMEQYSQYMKLERIIETKQFLLIKYFFSKERNAFVLINKANMKSYLTYLEPQGEIYIDYTGGILNDLDGGTSFIPKAYYLENGREYLIGLANPYNIISLIESSEFKSFSPKYPEKKKEFEKLANSLKETDNPVLMIVRLKKEVVQNDTQPNKIERKGQGFCPEL